MSYLYSTGYAVYDGTTNPNTVGDLDTGHNIGLAISQDGNYVWKYMPNNAIGSKWVELATQEWALQTFSELTGDNVAYTNVNNNFSTSQTVNGLLTVDNGNTNLVATFISTDNTAEIALMDGVTIDNTRVRLGAVGDAMTFRSAGVVNATLRSNLFDIGVPVDITSTLDVSGNIISGGNLVADNVVSNTTNSILTLSGNGTGYVRIADFLDVNGGIDVQDNIQHRASFQVLNKSATNWITWASRNTVGAESVIDLSNIGIINASGGTSTEWNTAYDKSITGASFNTLNGVYRITRQDGSNVDTDLDGRWLLFENWDTNNTDIDGLTLGSTFGKLIESPGAGHFVLGIKSNDDNDAFYILATDNADANGDYTEKLFEVSKNRIQYKGDNVARQGVDNNFSVSQTVQGNVNATNFIGNLIAQQITNASTSPLQIRTNGGTPIATFEDDLTSTFKGDVEIEGVSKITKNTSVLLTLARNNGASENMNIKFRGSSNTRNLGKTTDGNLRWGSSDDASLNSIVALKDSQEAFTTRQRINYTATDAADFVNYPYHLQLYSTDTLDSTDYISILFHHGNQTAGSIRYNSQGFYFQSGNSSTYRDVYVRDVISDRNVIANGDVQADEVLTTTLRTSSGQQLVLSAGESVAYATGQTNEYVFINAENGLVVESSPDNWASGWAGRTTGLFGTAASVDGKLRIGTTSGDNVLLIRGASTVAELTSGGIDITGTLDVSGQIDALGIDVDSGGVLFKRTGYNQFHIRQSAGSGLQVFDNTNANTVAYFNNNAFAVNTTDTNGYNFRVNGTAEITSNLSLTSTSYLYLGAQYLREVSVNGAIRAGGAFESLGLLRGYANLSVTGTGTFTSTVSGADATANNHFVTLQQLNNTVATVDTLDEVTQNGNWTEQGIVVRDSSIKVGSSTGANAVDSGTIDFLEDTDADFGALNGYGFRLNYNGDTNDFSLQAGSDTSVDTVFTVDRGASGKFIFNRNVTVNGMALFQEAVASGVTNANLTIYNDTNGAGAGIKFSDQAGTQTQYGTFKFFHGDTTFSGVNYGAHWKFESNQSPIAVQVPSGGAFIVGDDNVVDLANYTEHPTATGGTHEVYTWDKTLASFSRNGAWGYTYLVLETSVPQDAYSMGGFDIEIRPHYSETSSGYSLKLDGYWNPESNGGFIGWRYITNGNSPTIQVGRKSNGNTVFIITLSTVGTSNYPIVHARNLRLGYSANGANIDWGKDWEFIATNDISGYTNLNTLSSINLRDSNSLDGLDSSQFLRSDVNDTFEGGHLGINNEIRMFGAMKYYVSSTDFAHQRADARDEGTNSRLHWYGRNSADDANDRFRQAWYNGSRYYYVDSYEDGIRLGNATTTNGNFFELGFFNSTNLETSPQQWIRAYRASTFGQGSVAIGVGNADRLTIDYLGNVAIGTTPSTTHKFVVAGNIVSTNGKMYLSSGNQIYFDYNGSNDYAIRKSASDLAFTSGGDFTFNSNIDIEDDSPFLTIRGTNSSYSNAGIQLISGNASNNRALGVFHYVENSDVEWFAGLPYGGNDAYVINRNTGYTSPSSQSSPVGIGASQGRLFTITNSGNVGIGTDTPDFKLDVAGDIGIDGKIYHNGDHNTYIGFGADTQTFRTAGVDALTINSVQDVILTEDLRFSVGKMAIFGGTHLIYFDGSDTYHQQTSGGMYYYNNADTHHTWHNNSTQRMRLEGTGTESDPVLLRIHGEGNNTNDDSKIILSQGNSGSDLEIFQTGTNTRTDGLAANDQYIRSGQRLNLWNRSNGSEWNTKFQLNNDSIIFSTNVVNSAAIERMRIDSAGNVGIARTANASYRLDVNGNTNITGTLDVSSNISTTNGFAQFLRNADATTPIILLKLENEFTGQNVVYDFKLGSSKELIIDGTSASSKIISSQPVEITGTLDVSGVITGDGSGLTNVDADTLDGIDSLRIPYALNSGGTGNLGSTNTTVSDGGIGSDNIRRSMFYRDNTDFGRMGVHISHATNSNYALQIATTSYSSMGGLSYRLLTNGVWSTATTVIDNFNKSTYINKAYIDGLNIKADKIKINSNDNFTGTYPVLWGVSNEAVWEANWLNVNGATDTLNSVNFNASGTYTGDGSGLTNVDANQLGGNYNTDFLRSNAEDTASGKLTFTYLVSDLDAVGGTTGVTPFRTTFQATNRAGTGNYNTGLEFTYTDVGARTQLVAASSGTNNSGELWVRSESWSTASWSNWFKLLHTGNFVAGVDYAAAGDEDIIDGAYNIWNPDGSGADVFNYNDSNPTHNGYYNGAVVTMRGDGTDLSVVLRAGIFSGDHISVSRGYYVGNILNTASANTTQVIDGSGNWVGNEIDSTKLPEDRYVFTNTTGTGGSLDTRYRAEMFAWSPTTTGTKPSDSYGQGISIVSSGHEHNDLNNWITQLGFGTSKDTAYFRTKVNDGSWGSWYELLHSGNFVAGTDYASASHTHSAADITSGTLSDTRLSSNVALKNINNSFSIQQKINSTATAAASISSTSNHLELHSSNTGDNTDYISILFHHGTQTWGAIRHNNVGFHFTDGDDLDYKDVRAKDFYGTTYKIGGATILSGSSTVQLGSAGATGFINLSTTSGNALSISGLNSTFGGDVKIIKDEPWLTLDSSSSGSNTAEQAAGISLGESGTKGTAAVHITYTGDGKGWLGMGAVTNAVPAYKALTMKYNEQRVGIGGDYSSSYNVNVNGTTNFTSTINVAGTATFAGDIYANSGKIRSTDSTMDFYTPSNGALPIRTASVLASDSYADYTLVPTNGIYSKGDVKTSGNVILGTTKGLVVSSGNVNSDMDFDFSDITSTNGTFKFGENSGTTGKLETRFYDGSGVYTIRLQHDEGIITADSFIKSGGTSSQFLKADGSVDSNTYLTSASLSNYVTTNTTQTISGAKTFSSQVDFDSNAQFATNSVIQMGASGQLQLFSDNTNGYLRVFSGKLFLRYDTHNQLEVNSTGVLLNYLGSQKLTTTSGGITITGDSTVTGDYAYSGGDVAQKKGEFDYSTDASTSYTIASTDKGEVIGFTSASAVTVTVNPGSLTDVGDICYIDQMGSGEITITAGTGNSLLKNSSVQLKTNGLYSRVAIHKVSSTGYRVFGELKPV